MMRNAEGYPDPTMSAALGKIIHVERMAQKAAGRKYRPLVYICSPYAGDVESNVRAAKAYSRYAVGFEKLVNAEASNYFGRMGWSAGASMEQGLLYLTMPNGESRVDRWSIGAGATLPMRRGRSLLTISVGYSSMGDKAVMQRRCVTFGVAVSSCERWFVKRKYN